MVLKEALGFAPTVCHFLTLFYLTRGKGGGGGEITDKTNFSNVPLSDYSGGSKGVAQTKISLISGSFSENVFGLRSLPPLV